MDTKTCQRHPEVVKDFNGSIEELANQIGDLNYETMSELFKHLSKKIKSDSENDISKGRQNLSRELKYLHDYIKWASNCANAAWKISKPYM